jgi:hypothetical protein
MNHLPTRSLLACAAGLLLIASRSPAQGLDPYTRAVLTSASPYWGYTYRPYYQDPLAAQLHASADAVRAGAVYLRAEGDFLVKKMEAASLREDVRQKKLETRRKELEHWEWERDFRKNELNRQLERIRERQVEYNRMFPSVAEITGAGPLNSLFDELQRRQALPAAGSMKVEQEWLKQIHVTSGGRANIGLLKGDKVLWPRLLYRSNFADDREQMERLLDRAKVLAMAKQRNEEELHGTLDQLESAVRVCETRLDQEIRAGVGDPDCNPRHQIEVMKFLRQVTDATFVLERPDAAYYLNPVQGNTVAEMVAHMKKNGLRFAPATVGSERAYVALHRALADEVTRLKNMESPSNNR